VPVVGVVGIPAVQEVELRVAQLILPDAGLELRSIAGHETGGLVNDI